MLVLADEFRQGNVTGLPGYNTIGKRSLRVVAAGSVAGKDTLRFGRLSAGGIIPVE